MSASQRTLLGFDFGTRRIGIALGQELTGSARPLTTLESPDGGPDWAGITALIDEWRAEALVVGIPVHMDGSEHEVTRLASRFSNRLRGRYNLPVYTVDERLSSVQAEQRLAGHLDFSTARARADSRAAIDAMAAQIILQNWLDQQK